MLVSDKGGKLKRTDELEKEKNTHYIRKNWSSFKESGNP